MTNDATSRTINEMRVDAFAAIVALCAEGLPAPMDIGTTTTHHEDGLTSHSLSLRLDDDRPEQVDQWAAALNLGEPTNTPLKGFVSRKAEQFDYDDGFWRGWHKVDVWAAVHAGGAL